MTTVQTVATFDIDLETLRLIVLLVREHYELTGSFPTATQLRALIRRPI